MATFSDDQRRARTRTITDAARRCFTRTTFDETTMADIVKESGLASRVVTGLFPTKDDVMRQVAVALMDDSIAEVAEVARRRPILEPAQVLRELALGAGIRSQAPLRIHGWSDFLADPELAAPIHDYALQQHELFDEYAQAWLESCGRTPEEARLRADSVATVLYGLLQGVLMLLAVDPTMTVGRFVDAVRGIDLAPDPAAQMSRTVGRT